MRSRPTRTLDGGMLSALLICNIFVTKYSSRCNKCAYAKGRRSTTNGVRYEVFELQFVVSDVEACLGSERNAAGTRRDVHCAGGDPSHVNTERDNRHDLNAAQKMYPPAVSTPNDRCRISQNVPFSFPF